jgi:hypothetical protein
MVHTGHDFDKKNFYRMKQVTELLQLVWPDEGVLIHSLRSRYLSTGSIRRRRLIVWSKPSIPDGALRRSRGVEEPVMSTLSGSITLYDQAYTVQKSTLLITLTATGSPDQLLVALPASRAGS